MLSLNAISKTYKKKPAVDHVSFEVPSGTICVLLGPNGAGKSTLLKSCAGLLTHGGIASINGIDMTSVEGKRRFSYIPELPAVYDDLTVEEHLQFIASAYGIMDWQEKANILLKDFELDEKRDILGSELSKGMLQKTSICMAFITNPECILVDEPMVGLDPKAILTFKKKLCELSQKGATILISTHMLEMVEDLWDMVIVLSDGTVAGQFTKEELKQESVSQKFFELTEGVKKNGSN